MHATPAGRDAQPRTMVSVKPSLQGQIHDSAQENGKAIGPAVQADVPDPTAKSPLEDPAVSTSTAVTVPATVAVTVTACGADAVSTGSGPKRDCDGAPAAANGDAASSNAASPAVQLRRVLLRAHVPDS